MGCSFHQIFIICHWLGQVLCLGMTAALITKLRSLPLENTVSPPFLWVWCSVLGFLNSFSADFPFAETFRNSMPILRLAVPMARSSATSARALTFAFLLWASFSKSLISLKYLYWTCLLSVLAVLCKVIPSTDLWSGPKVILVSYWNSSPTVALYYWKHLKLTVFIIYYQVIYFPWALIFSRWNIIYLVGRGKINEIAWQVKKFLIRVEGEFILEMMTEWWYAFQSKRMRKAR